VIRVMPPTVLRWRRGTNIDELAPTDSAVDEPLIGDDRPRRRRLGSIRRLAEVALPVIALVLACGAGYLKWVQASADADARAATEAMRAASENTIAILSYKADSVEQDLGAASSRLTGDFKNSYASLTHEVVIPGAKQRQISLTATVPAAAPISASEQHAVVLLFVNQTVTMGQTPPSDTASSVKVTLDKRDGRWLISGFDPV
jgi:Mce-associated membrane protein